MYRKGHYWIVLIVVCFFCCAETREVEVRENGENSPALGKRGMVSSAHPIATEAGLDILRRGGNAFDAAVAIASTLNVVEPMMSGIGGYGTIVVYDSAEKRAHYLDASGKIPLAVDSDVYRPPTPNYKENRRNAKAVSTPGALNAWEAMSERFGKMRWHELLETAVRIADEGFVIDERTARLIRGAYPEFPEHAKKIFGREGKPLPAGERLVQSDLARTLRLISQQGAGALYGGELGKAAAAAMEQAGGFLALEDLVKDRAEWWEPISIEYRDHEVITASPPAGAFPSLIRLGMMGLADNKRLGHNSPAYLHRFAEISKHAYWTRLAYSGDPEIKPPPLDMLLSENYWAEQNERIDPERARDFSYDGIVTTPGENTTHFVVADQWGGIVSATVTLGNSFGSRIMPEGTGFWLNNSLAYCTFEPKGNPMDAHPGRRKLSSDAPSIVLRGGRPWIALGTPGGHTITQTVPQMIMNLIDFGMNIQEAIAAPRISFAEPNTLAVESGIPEVIRNQLKAMGHNIRLGRLGNAHGLLIEYDDQGKPVRFAGGADPRGQGLANGY